MKYTLKKIKHEKARDSLKKNVEYHSFYHNSHEMICAILDKMDVNIKPSFNKLL